MGSGMGREEKKGRCKRGGRKERERERNPPIPPRKKLLVFLMKKSKTIFIIQLGRRE